MEMLAVQRAHSKYQYLATLSLHSLGPSSTAVLTARTEA